MHVKFFISFFKNFCYRASEKMYANIFFLKLNISILSQSILFPHIFILKNNKLKAKIFRFTLTTLYFKYLLLSLLLASIGYISFYFL